MLNIDIFLKRLDELMENHQLNAAAFAEKIGVQRSSVSHILSRRNKPSLDFILKIQSQFEEADFDWLLLGSQKKTSPTPSSLDRSSANFLEEKAQDKKDWASTPQIPELEQNNSEITQIIQTYKDGSFRVFLPKS